jgi:NTE family protein
MSDTGDFDGAGRADTAPTRAFVLGGGGMLGAAQVGMLRALLEDGLVPDVVLGASVGAVNGAFIAAQPTSAGVEQLTGIWTSLSRGGVFAGSLLSQAVTVARHRTHLHAPGRLAALLQDHIAVDRIEDLAIAYQCVAASIERASAHWFCDGPLVDAVLASSAVPGLLPPAVVGGEHFYDGGLVDSTPVGRAVQLGATEIYVLHVGRLERELRAPRAPWEVGLVAFEIARRHRFVESLAAVPDGCRVHVLPAGRQSTPLINLRYRGTRNVRETIDMAYDATARSLEAARAAT